MWPVSSPFNKLLGWIFNLNKSRGLDGSFSPLGQIGTLTSWLDL